MKKSLLILLLACMQFAASAQGRLNKGFKTFKVYAGKDLQMNRNDSFSFSAEIVKGNMLVFEYHYQKDEYADMSDDELTERILFAVPANTGSFELSGDKLSAAYLRSCFCMDRGWHDIRDGIIRGKKINATSWQVEISINTRKEPDRSANPIAIDVQGTFVLEKQPVHKPAPKKKTIVKKK